ncbi:MAG TPA: long-chain-acyl-CoA synthetase [Pseudolabrys sp.]|nr:long-chain-acyl-CoA synthetase [Pseudolabrys sp.]
MGLFSRLKGDLTYLRGALRALKLTTPIAKNPERVFPHVIEELAARFGDAPALIGSSETLTYRQLGRRANQYARWARAQGLAKGEAVCLLMPNRPEYMAIWIGIIHAGGTVALINTNLVGLSLAHCIDVAAPRHVIVAAELMSAFKAIEGSLKTRPQVWLHGPGDRQRIDIAIEAFDETPLGTEERVPLTIEDHALYIYTSGTTGMPKAANINHYRVMLAAFGFAGVIGTTSADRMYDCLPMYHTVGGLAATGSVLVNGGSVIIRERFSAHEFWNDIVRHECTLFQYIGELCRYLLLTPPAENETRHKLRLVCGNGLRPDIWKEFKTRFRIPHILEFYAATEGNVTMFNFEDKAGAIGRIPWFLAHRFPTALVRFDVETERPVRDAQGFCIQCAVDEAGEAIGKIIHDPSKPAARFEGYASKADDERKVLRDVFEKGDAWFRTGDLMRKDAEGFFYFVDRVGDTFRWKGENVSTSEVAEAIGRFPGIAEVNVYGVAIPGKDGRAGMAAMVTSGDLDLGALRQHLMRTLPDYARPVFLRIRSEIEVTTTFKQKKIDLVKQGFDPAATGDTIYFNDHEAGAFVRLDAALYSRICNGGARL